MVRVVYYSPGIDYEISQAQIRMEGVQTKPIDQVSPDDTSPRILILDQEYLEEHGEQVMEHSLGTYLILNRERDLSRFKFPPDVLIDYSVEDVNPLKIKNFIRSALLKQAAEEMRMERDTHLQRLKELNKIGIALSTERDPVRLLNMILRKSREVTWADAGSLYLVEDEGEGRRTLRFKISQNDSLPVNYEEFVMPITKDSISGYVAISGEPLNIPDVYQIGDDHEYGFNRNLDESTGYRTISMLTVPLKNHNDEIIGIIQLINRKRSGAVHLSRANYKEEVRAFDASDVDVVSSLASQAAIALENSTLIKSIERLFEGFVTAAVTAIESRDPTTSGHSFRVADLTVKLAEFVDRSDNFKFREVNFTYDQIKEIRYASLLHDFGKVGVRENVLVKAKKLYPLQIDLIRQRFRYIRKAWEAEYYKSKMNLALSENYTITEATHLEKSYRERLNSLDNYLNFIVQSNEPSVLAQGNFERLIRIASERDLIPPGDDDTLLSPEEVQLLSIRKGSLNEQERVEIESHVTHTFLFLSKIPWTSELKDVPRIAYGHHEKLNGRGYPNRLISGDIPIQTRMMTISDIYDALTASDRPYKRAVPSAKALDILADEVKQEQVDGDLFDLFLEGKVYQLTTGKS